MRAYRVTVSGHQHFAGSQSDAKSARDQLLESAGINPRSKAAKEEATVEEVEIPTSKLELLDWINELVAEVTASANSSDEGEENEEG